MHHQALIKLLKSILTTVKKGLITGRSNSIWHGLFLKKDVFNCIDEDKPYFSQTKMHKYSMKYFDVHGNYKSTLCDKSILNKVDDRTRNVDFLYEASSSSIEILKSL